jgi:hypothetical protein
MHHENVCNIARRKIEVVTATGSKPVLDACFESRTFEIFTFPFYKTMYDGPRFSIFLGEEKPQHLAGLSPSLFEKFSIEG